MRDRVWLFSFLREMLMIRRAIRGSMMKPIGTWLGSVSSLHSEDYLHPVRFSEVLILAVGVEQGLASGIRGRHRKFHQSSKAVHGGSQSMDSLLQSGGGPGSPPSQRIAPAEPVEPPEIVIR